MSITCWVGPALQVWSVNHTIIIGYLNKWLKGTESWFILMSVCLNLKDTKVCWLPNLPICRVFLSSVNPEPQGCVFPIAGGHWCFRVPVTGIVSGLMSLWQGCCWWRCICFDRTLKNYFSFQGDLCMCGLSQCICLPSSAQKMLLWKDTMRVKTKCNTFSLI